MMTALAKNIELPAPVPGAPGMFRCSKPGLMSSLFQEAGFKEIKEKEINGSVDFGSPERYWENMNEIGAQVVNAMAHADETTRHKIKADALAIFKETAGQAKLNYNAVVYRGVK